MEEPKRGGAEFHGEGGRRSREGDPERAEAPPETGWSPRAAGTLHPALCRRAFLQIIDRLVDYLLIDPTFFVGIAEEQAVGADDVGGSWDTAPILHHPGHPCFGEKAEARAAAEAPPGP